MTEKERLIMEEMMYSTDSKINERAAKLLYDMYTEYKKAGFTPSQAFSLVKGVLLTTVETSMRIARG